MSRTFGSVRRPGPAPRASGAAGLQERRTNRVALGEPVRAGVTQAVMGGVLKVTNKFIPRRCRGARNG